MIHQFPNLPIGIVLDQFLIAFSTHLASPDDICVVNVGAVVDPLLVYIVPLSIVDKY